MTRVLKVLLLYQNKTWKELDLVTSKRYITMNEIYELLPTYYQTEDLYKIISLGFNGHYALKTLKLNEN